MYCQDSVSLPTGSVELVVSRGGVVIERSVEHNLVVDKAKLLLARLIGGQVSNQSVGQIAFGTNGSAPAAGNTSLTSQFSKPISGVTYPADGQVRFSFTLDATEANGKAILEFGLLSVDGTLFARKVRSSALNKDSDISVSGTWTITF